MNSEKTCRKCGVILIPNVNWAPSRIKYNNYICNPCGNKVSDKWQKDNREQHLKSCREHYYRNGGKPMLKNKECSSFLGVHIAEKILSKVFKNVEVMPPNHSNYDFICNHGKTIDVKSSCINKFGRWAFSIKKNTIADYFLILAFDNRENLNPLYVWLIPSTHICNLVSATISKSTLHKWDKYKLDISKTVKCCNNMKGE